MKCFYELFIGGCFTHRANLFLFPPDDFLRLASFVAGETKPAARRMFDRGVPFCSLPFLRLQEISSEVYGVIRHNGRHRATVLRDNGYETMPVRLYIRQKKSDDKSWPETIKAQEDAEDPEFTIPLPPRLDPDHWPEP